MSDLVHFNFNKIYVIESLKPIELQTGELLYNDILSRKVLQMKNLEAELLKSFDRKDFFESLEHIHSETATKNKFPFIHLDVHGSKDKDGVILGSDEFITWYEVASRLRAINILTKNNMVVSFSTCYGAYIYGQINPIEPAPFWGAVGPWEAVNVDDVEISFNAFFDTLLPDLDFTNAVKVLNSANNLPIRFYFHYSENVFNKVMDQNEKTLFDPDALSIRLDRILNAAANDEAPKDMQREYAVKLLLNTKEYYRALYRNLFLMLE